MLPEVAWLTSVERLLWKFTPEVPVMVMRGYCELYRLISVVVCEHQFTQEIS